MLRQTSFKERMDFQKAAPGRKLGGKDGYTLRN
jgi:hypothetical protein